MTVDEPYALGTYFPGLLNYVGQDFPTDIVWMISVQVDFKVAILSDGGYWCSSWYSYPAESISACGRAFVSRNAAARSKARRLSILSRSAALQVRRTKKPPNQSQCGPASPRLARRDFRAQVFQTPRTDRCR